MVVKKRIEEGLKCPFSFSMFPPTAAATHSPASSPSGQALALERSPQHGLSRWRNDCCGAPLLDVIRGRCLRDQGTHAEA
eukprot:454412-Pleurochrysis_carterae.AAC.1